MYISALTDERVLCLVFDQHETSLGAVRLRLQEHRRELMDALADESA